MQNLEFFTYSHAWLSNIWIKSHAVFASEKWSSKGFNMLQWMINTPNTTQNSQSKPTPNFPPLHLAYKWKKKKDMTLFISIGGNLIISIWLDVQNDNTLFYSIHSYVLPFYTHIFFLFLLRPYMKYISTNDLIS